MTVDEAFGALRVHFDADEDELRNAQRELLRLYDPAHREIDHQVRRELPFDPLTAAANGTYNY